MDSFKNIEYTKCRTCYDSTTNLQMLTDLAEQCSSETFTDKTYAQLLLEVCDINVMDDKPLGRWPKFICLNCSHKLKLAYDFIQHTQRINVQLESMANLLQSNYEAACMEKPPLDIPLEFKTESIEDDVVLLNEPELPYSPVEMKVFSAGSPSLRDEECEQGSSNSIFDGATTSKNKQAKQYVVPSVSHALEDEPPIESSLSKNEPTMHDVLKVLNTVVENQKMFSTQLNQIMENQNVLNHSQKDMVNNQQFLCDKLVNAEANALSKPEIKDQTKRLKEAQISLKRIEKSVSRMTGETQDEALDEVISMFPLLTMPAVQELEQKLDSPEFVQLMKTYTHKLKGTSEDVGSVMRLLFTDNVLEYFNWEGRWEKLSLGKLLLFNKVLRDVFQQQDALDFEKSVRKAVERSHHRINQKNYLKKANK